VHAALHATSIQYPIAASHTVLFVCSNVRSELTQLKSSEASIQATAEEVQQQLQQKDSMIESLNKELDALKAKLADLERY
jgi:peptidoglycan hydrolase CwlO-like protein